MFLPDFVSESEVDENTVFLSDAMKTEVSNLFGLGIKTRNTIRKALAENNFEIPF